MTLRKNLEVSISHVWCFFSFVTRTRKGFFNLEPGLCIRKITSKIGIHVNELLKFFLVKLDNVISKLNWQQSKIWRDHLMPSVIFSLTDFICYGCTLQTKSTGLEFPCCKQPVLLTDIFWENQVKIYISCFPV